MAVIKIEEKRRSWLPWLLGAIAVAGVVWFVAMRNEPETNMAGRTDARGTDSAAGTLVPARDSAMGMRDSIIVPPPR